MLENLSLRNGLRVLAGAAVVFYVSLGMFAYTTIGTLGGAGAKAAQERIVAAVVVGLVVLALAIWRLHGHFNQRVEQLVDATQIFAAGDCDLRRRLPVMSGAFGKVCSTLNGFVDQLHDLVSSVARNAGEIARAARQVSADNGHLASRSAEQSSTLREMAASMEAFTVSVKRNADNARLASRLASSASATAKEGGAVVSQAVAMINAANEGSRQIGSIVSTIDSLAFQTNILALNAAVEAARAGDHGRGFAVVAAEVRALAQRCAAAAKEIKGMVGTAIERVDEGAKLAGKAGGSMEEIVVAIQQASDIMGQIDADASEQASGIERVHRALGQSREATRQNAELVEQGAAAARAMREQAEELSNGIARFKLA